ncbi:hypothetical protein VTK26DRAFT_3087 [Humicola hyalothermophila]
MGAPIVAAPSRGMPPLDTGAHPEGSIVHRDTKGGRRLWYCLKVIQQPERARACGSGPKSSADRRPVDPPPVVELRIYEGQTWELAQEKDITFVYNANFFLFATLEHARMLAHARGTPAPSTNTPPVLTGMPVSGMAYLDRPQEAGYFLFPDLSVRHEGRYRLTFNLYEETKDEKDKDKEDDGDNQPPIPGVNPATGGSFDFRMEVKSQEFVVYSAKKFPGLAESTPLSRVVAEQGCRVRIRRDVRMRRRDGKGAGDYDNAEDDYNRRRRTATPDTRTDYNRARSMSGGSTERTPYSADPNRRPSIADYPPQYPPQPSSSGGHLRFLGANSGSEYAHPAQPPQNFAQPPSVPASPVYPPPQAQAYQLPSTYHSRPPPPPAPAPYSRERTPSQPYPPITPATRPDNVQSEYRPPSGQVVTLPPPSALSSSPSTSYHPPTPQPRAQIPPPPPPPTLAPSPKSQLPPLQSLLPSPTATSAPRPPAPAPLPVPILAPPPVSSSSGPINPKNLPPAAVYAGTKRAHGQTFRSEDEPRRQNGARDEGRAEDVDAGLNEPMIFHRADGKLKDALRLGY